MTTGISRPTTEAGRRLLDRLSGVEPRLVVQTGILAIEAEAQAEQRATIDRLEAEKAALTGALLDVQACKCEGDDIPEDGPCWHWRAVDVLYPDLATSSEAWLRAHDAQTLERARAEGGEALFSMAFAAAGREHLDHGAEPFSSLVTCSDVICRARAVDLQCAIDAGVATMRPDDEWLLSPTTAESEAEA